jgi:FtsP/CotA-like multicopper oxidase with cupredoxin domain
VIRARQGQPLKLRFINDLDRDIWLHFFGVRGPAELMTINVPRGADHAVDCVFTPPDAGTFWIAPMSDQSRLRDMGLNAVLVVEEAVPLQDVSDLVLVLDDWKLAEDGTVEGNFGDVEAMVGEGRLGNWFTVNNGFRPKLELARDSYTRLRILNAANVRTMFLLFKGQDPLLIARDGQPVKPATLHGKALSLAPGDPLHIHGHAWQVIGQDPPAPFQDTVVVPAGETVSLAFTADNVGLWALHSLVAERADGGLIGTFTVTE